MKIGDQLDIAKAKTLLANESRATLESLARASHALTRQRFGNTIRLYAPVYISNSCINACVYCGFRNSNNIPRRSLAKDEVIAEAEAIISRGHRHILLVAGEDPRTVTVELLEDIARALRPRVAGLTIEVQPFDEDGYRRLADAGIDGVTLYQETYDENAYEKMHPAGPKSIFGARLKAIDDAGRAGMRFLGIGALLGISDWRRETLAIIEHARALMKRHWQSAITVSVPRIRDSASGFEMPCPVSDRDLARMICVLRLALPDCGIVLSTREPAALRDNLLPFGITQMSAGSVTSPGGYTRADQTGEQFHLEDTRSPDAVAQMLKDAGYDPVWKDWDKAFQTGDKNANQNTSSMRARGFDNGRDEICRPDGRN